MLQHTTSTTPGRCSTYFPEAKQYVVIECPEHAGTPAGRRIPEQPACGNVLPHRSHNGFASVAKEPWCIGVGEPEDGGDVPPTSEQLKELLDKNRAYAAELGSMTAARDLERRRREESMDQAERLLNERDTARMDMTHIRRWCSERLKAKEGALLAEAQRTDQSFGQLIGIAGQMRGLKDVLAEISRLEKA